MQNNVIKDGLSFRLDTKEKTSSIVGCNGIQRRSIKYNVPTTIKIDSDEYPVTKIDKDTFLHNNSIETIIFPNDCQISLICEDSFYYSTIKYITIPESVIKIERRAFHSCSHLKTVIFQQIQNWK